MTQPVLPPGPYNPAAVAALGPNFSEGRPYIPAWRFNRFNEGHVAVIPANYGSEGGIPGWQRRFNSFIGTPQQPANLTHKPVWNMLIPVANWHLQVLTKQQLQSFENSQDVQAPQLPVTFSAPGTASLMK